MAANAMTSLWARTGLVWFVATMSFGMYLGITQQFGFSSPHAHLGLLGWLSSIAFSFLYSVADPDGTLVRAPRLHWAMHNLGVVVMVSALYLTLKTGNESLGAVIALGGTIIILATLWLIVMLWPRLGRR